jgi:small subunit ribosomal protein S19
MGRSTKKGPFVNEKLLAKVRAMLKAGDKKVIKTWARSCTISPEFVGLTFAIHNGRKFLPIFISEEMVGHKLGELAPTRFFKGHGEAHTKEATALT